MADESFLEAVLAARAEAVRAMLLAPDDLDRLRSITDEVNAGSESCDGCGCCCTAQLSMTRLEYERIERLVAAEPGLVRQQGLVCPFLDFDPRRFARSVAAYGRTRAPAERFSCRVYRERPLICRLYPAPTGQRCREHNTLEPPDLVGALQTLENEDYPNLLIQKTPACLRGWREKARVSVQLGVAPRAAR